MKKQYVRCLRHPHIRYEGFGGVPEDGMVWVRQVDEKGEPLGELYQRHISTIGPEPRDEPSTSEAPKPSGGALRHNSGKTPFSAFPLDLCSGAARVMGKGRIKYAKGNYRKGYEDVESPTDSLIRHTGVVQRAVEADDKDGLLGYLFDESGECHIHHVVTSALLIIQTMQLLGWDVEKTYSRMIKTSDGKCFPEEYANAKGIKGDLYVNGIKQTESKSAS